jgi:hypothetical protein
MQQLRNEEQLQLSLLLAAMPFWHGPILSPQWNGIIRRFFYITAPVMHAPLAVHAMDTSCTLTSRAAACCPGPLLVPAILPVTAVLCITIRQANIQVIL